MERNIQRKYYWKMFHREWKIAQITYILTPILHDCIVKSGKLQICELLGAHEHHYYLNCTITEKSSVTFSLGGDNLKRYFDQR